MAVPERPEAPTFHEFVEARSARLLCTAYLVVGDARTGDRPLVEGGARCKLPGCMSETWRARLR